MRIELKAGAVQLRGSETLRVVDGAGSTVCAVEGSVWITEENQASDIVLAEGACYRLRNRGLAVINPLGGTASVELT